MGRPVAIRKIIIELNVHNVVVLRDALLNYNDYLEKQITFEAHDTKLTKKQIKQRIRYTEDFIESLEMTS